MVSKAALRSKDIRSVDLPVSEDWKKVIGSGQECSFSRVITSVCRLMSIEIRRTIFHTAKYSARFEQYFHFACNCSFNAVIERTCDCFSWQAQLSLAKLCAMVTMKKPGETSIQSFSLPLTSLVTDEQAGHDQEAIEKVCLWLSWNMIIIPTWIILLMFMMLSSWHSCCESLSGFCD